MMCCRFRRQNGADYTDFSLDGSQNAQDAPIRSGGAHAAFRPTSKMPRHYTRWPEVTAARTAACAAPATLRPALSHPQLVEQDPPDRVVLIVAHALGDEVCALWSEQRHPRRQVDESALDSPPQPNRGLRVGRSEEHT